MTRFRTAVYVTYWVVYAVVVAWLVFAADPMLEARMWLYLSRISQHAAYRFGRAAITAERNYFEAVQNG